MKIKRKIKTSVKYFFVSAFFTLLFIVFCTALIITEKNTAEIGLSNISDVLSFEQTTGGAVLTVNDRAIKISLAPIYEMLKSRSLYACLGVFLML